MNMTAEEKAKAYDEAINRAKAILKVADNRQESLDYVSTIFPELVESEDERIRKALVRFHKSTIDIDGIKGADILAWLEKQSNPNKEYHRVPSTILKRLYMNEAKYELLKSDIMEGIVGDFEKGTTHSYLTIKIPMLLCPSNCIKGDKVKLIIVREE